MFFMAVIVGCFLYLAGMLGTCSILLALFDYAGEEHDTICILAALFWPLFWFILIIVMLLDLLWRGIKKGMRKICSMIIRK